MEFPNDIQLEIVMVPHFYRGRDYGDNYTPEYRWQVVQWNNTETSLSREILARGYADTHLGAFQEGDLAYRNMRNQWVADAIAEGKYARLPDKE